VKPNGIGCLCSVLNRMVEIDAKAREIERVLSSVVFACCVMGQRGVGNTEILARSPLI